jgi:dynein heavy chain
MVTTSSAVIRETCASLCQQFFSDTSLLSKKFLTETKRKQYVTPLSYLELLSTYKSLLEEKRESILNEKRRYEILRPGNQFGKQFGNHCLPDYCC